MSPASAALLDVVAHDVVAPVVQGGHRRMINLDYAASSPPLRVVADAVNEFLPWYSSVHRGAGFASSVSTEALAAARSAVGAFLGARDDDVVVFTRNTTDSLNLLARALPSDATVITFDVEHHANLLPWRSEAEEVLHLATPRCPRDLASVLDAALAGVRSANVLVAVTAASNVTGEVLPIRELCDAAHRHGARVVVDAAQLAPHRRIDISDLGADYLAFSGHKLYAPFGAGVLVGRADWLDRAEPYLAGGGATAQVTLDDVRWLESPARHEGGTPNVVGAVALAAACRALSEIDAGALQAHDDALTARLDERLARLPVRLLHSFTDSGRVGIAALVADDPTRSAGLLAASLSAEHAIATRDGAFCAHPFVRRLLDDGTGRGSCGDLPAALRASVGVGSSIADIDLFADALEELLSAGPRWDYVVKDGRLTPDPDPRPRPPLWGM